MTEYIRKQSDSSGRMSSFAKYQLRQLLYSCFGTSNATGRKPTRISTQFMNSRQVRPFPSWNGWIPIS